jgi:RNA polymerase sigma-70 factor, ECF subfamily
MSSSLTFLSRLCHGKESKISMQRSSPASLEAHQKRWLLTLPRHLFNMQQDTVSNKVQTNQKKKEGPLRYNCGIIYTNSVSVNKSNAYKRISVGNSGSQGDNLQDCRAYTHDASELDDLFQEVLLSLWKAFPTFKGESKISTWIYKVALYTVLTNVKEKKKRLKHEQINELHEALIAEPLIDDPEEKITSLYAAISKLPPVDKAIVLLMLEEKSYNEVSEIIGLNAAAVGMRIKRLKEKLNSLMNALK